MTTLLRLMRAVKSNAGLNPNFEHYYSKLLRANAGEIGMPTAREAQRDHEATLRLPNYYSML